MIIGAASDGVREDGIDLVEEDGHVVARRPGDVGVAPLLQCPVRLLDLKLIRAPVDAEKLIKIEVRGPRGRRRGGGPSACASVGKVPVELQGVEVAVVPCFWRGIEVEDRRRRRNSSVKQRYGGHSPLLFGD